MELRCAWRSTNISETSRFELSIRYLLRLIAISSTENAQCGVLTPPWIIHLRLKHRFEPCCTAQKPSRADLFFPDCFSPQVLVPHLPPTPPVTGGWPMASPTSASRNAMAASGVRLP